MVDLRWWLQPRLATELDRHTPMFWHARGVGLTEFDRAMLRLTASVQTFSRHLGDVLLPVVQGAAVAFQGLAAAFAPVADAHAVVFCNATGHSVQAGTGRCACGVTDA